ncbi:MAG: Uma2 family endonuclease [Myxococcota bacterium]
MTTTPPTHKQPPRTTHGQQADRPRFPEDEGFDWSTWHLTEEEDMGQSLEQNECIITVLGVVSHWVQTRGWADRMYVGADVFFKWVPGREHNVMVSPDLFLLEPHPPIPLPPSLKTWNPGVYPPRLAVEIVSEDWRKDYLINPDRYDHLGVEELVIFDPVAARTVLLPGIEPERVALQVYQRGEGGRLQCVARGDAPAWSEVLEGWWVVVSTPSGARLRLASAPSLEALVPSPPEALAQARAMLELAQLEHEELEHDLEHTEQRLEHTEQILDQVVQEREEAVREREKAIREREEAIREREEAIREQERERRARLKAEAEMERLRALLEKGS